MTAEDDRPTTAECYARATHSSDLKVHNNRRGDVDMMIASGWHGDRLGTLLFRLRSEWDSVRADHHQAEHTLSDSMHDAHDDEDVAAAERAALTARALIMVHLQTLPAAMNALLAFAVLEAVHVRFRSRGQAIQKVAGRALEAWLDPTCPACGGRGKNGGFGAPLVTCVRCHGFRLRRPRLGDSDEAHEFGRRLLVCMDSRTEYAARQMQKFLRER